MLDRHAVRYQGEHWIVYTHISTHYLWGVCTYTYVWLHKHCSMDVCTRRLVHSTSLTGLHTLHGMPTPYAVGMCVRTHLLLRVRLRTTEVAHSLEIQVVRVKLGQVHPSRGDQDLENTRHTHTYVQTYTTYCIWFYSRIHKNLPHQ